MMPSALALHKPNTDAVQHRLDSVVVEQMKPAEANLLNSEAQHDEFELGNF